MRYRHRILLLTSSVFQSRLLNRFSDRHDFFPGTRVKNYLELLSGFGLPHDSIDISDFDPCDIVKNDELRYSAVLLTCPLKELDAGRWLWLENASKNHGVTLITDSFLMSSDKYRAFGVLRCAGLVISAQVINSADNRTLMQTKLYPYSPQGRDNGLKPILRFLIQSWYSRSLILGDAEAVASFPSGKPAVTRNQFGRGSNYLLNFHPSPALREGNLLHAWLRQTLENSPNVPSVSIDLSGTACLRLDDPGSCERVHLEGSNSGVLSGAKWRRLFDSLSQEGAHINIAYVPQWVDDGDQRRGRLNYQGREIEQRTPGEHYNSWELVYSKAGAPGSHDYTAEYRALREAVLSGQATILSHGLTHLTTDLQAWLKARNRYTKAEWFREFREMAGGKRATAQDVVNRMSRSADLIEQAYGQKPTIIVPAGHEATDEVPDHAREAGFQMIASRGIFLLRKDRTDFNRKLLAFYLVDMEYGLSFLEAGYPVTLVLHDYDFSDGAGTWLLERLHEMRMRGAQRFISLEELGFLLMANLDILRDGPRIFVRADFSDCISPGDQIQEIRFNVQAKISGVTIFDREAPVSIESADNVTILTVPMSALRESKLELCLLLSNL